VLGVAAACGSSSSSGTVASADASAGCAPYEVPAGFDASMPAVSFRDHVLPIFRRSCGLSPSCHQGASSTTRRIYLGSPQITDNSDATLVRAGIVGVASLDLPSMAVVSPGDPSQSFLMHKLDGDQCAFDAQCVGGDCLLPMPQGSYPMATPDRDSIRRWIAQGALDD
jgi:hypothetical protein